MANTIAGTNKTATVYGEGAFNKLFGTVYTFTGTVSDQDAVAATAIGEFDLAAPGVVLGDMVLGVAVNVALDDATDQATLTAHVSAADVITVQLCADDAEFAADKLNTKTIKVLVGRPTW